MEMPRGEDAKSGAIAITGNGCSNDDDDLSIYMDVEVLTCCLVHVVYKQQSSKCGRIGGLAILLSY
jgi:hypothetical protein